MKDRIEHLLIVSLLLLAIVIAIYTGSTVSLEQFLQMQLFGFPLQ